MKPSNRRRYLTEAELNALIKAARKGRYGQRDATLILIMARGGVYENSVHGGVVVACRSGAWCDGYARSSRPSEPPAFVIAEIDVTNQDGFVKEFAPLAVKALGENGPGYKAIARGGKTVAIEGAPPKTRIVINHFDSLDAAMAAYNSAAYKKAREVGNKYGTFRIYATEGVAQ